MSVSFRLTWGRVTWTLSLVMWVGIVLPSRVVAPYLDGRPIDPEVVLALAAAATLSITCTALDQWIRPA